MDKLIKRLRELGFSEDVLIKLGSIRKDELMHMNSRELAEFLGVKRREALRILEVMFKIYTQEMYLPASSLSGRRRISLGVTALDRILGGGLPLGSIVEVFGEPGVGKTQFCFHLTARKFAALGFSKKAAYIDAEGSFSPKRLREVLEGNGVHPDVAMREITLIKPKSTAMLYASLLDLWDEFENYDLVLVDSLLALPRLEYHGLDMLAERQQMLAKILRLMLKISGKGILVLFTNQTIGKITSSEGKDAAGGFIVGHVPGTVLQIRKAAGGVRVLRIVDSPELPEAEALFKIGRKGLIGVTRRS